MDFDVSRVNAEANIITQNSALEDVRTTTDSEGAIVLVTGGDLTLNAGSDSSEALVADGSGNVRLDVTGALTLNAELDAGSGHLSLLAMGTLTQAASGDVTTSGTGTLDVQANAIAMAGEAVTSAGSGNVRYVATDTLALGALSTGGNVSLSAASITDSNDMAMNVSANQLRIVTTGTDDGQGVGTSNDALEIDVDRLAASVSGTATGGLFLTEADSISVGTLSAITINRVGADDTDLALTDDALGDLASAGHLVLSTAAGRIETLATNGEITAAGNLLLKAAGADSDLVLNAAVSSTGGHVSLDAGRDLLQNAGITAGGAGKSVDVLAGGDVTMAAGTGITSTDGNVRVEASDSVALRSISAGSGHVAVLATMGAIVDADDNDSVNVTATDLILQAGAGVGSGSNAIETGVSTLAVGAGTGGVFVTERDALVVDAVDFDVSRVNAEANIITQNSALEDVRTTADSDGAIVLVTGGDLTLNAGSDSRAAVVADGSGNVRLDVTGALTLNAELDAGSGHLSLLATGTLTQAASGDVTTSGTGTLDVQANAIAMAGEATTSAGSGNVRYVATETLALGALSTGGSVSLMAGSISDANGAAVNVTADELRLVTTGNGADEGAGTGADALETKVNRLAADVAGASGLYLVETDSLILGSLDAINVHQVAADGVTLTQTTDVALSEVSSAGALVLITGEGSLTTEAEGGVVSAAGNLLMKVGGAESDLELNAAVSSTGGHISLDAGQNIAQNATIATQADGKSIDLLAGGDVTMADGTRTLTNAGNIRYQATSGDLTVSSLDAGSADVSLVAQSILDGGESHIDVSANNLRLQAANGIGNDGTFTNALDTRVDILTASASSAGVFINEYDALTLDNVGPVSVSRVLADGSSINPDSTESVVIDSRQSRAVTGGTGSIVIEAGSLIANPDGDAQNVAVSAVGSGNVRLQARGDNDTDGNLDVRGLVRGGSGHISLLAAGDVNLAGLANILNTTSDSSIEVDAGQDIVMAADATVTSVGSGNVRFEAGRDIQVASISVGASSSAGKVALVAGGSIIDAHVSEGDQSSGTVNIVAAGLLMNAGAGVGSETNRIETNVFTVSAHAETEGMYLYDTTSVTVGQVSVTSQRVQEDASLANAVSDLSGPVVDEQSDLQTMAGGDLVLGAAAITVAEDALVQAANGDVQLLASGNITLSNSASLDAVNGNLEVTSTGGNIEVNDGVISAGGNLELTSALDTMLTATVAATGESKLTAGGDLSMIGDYTGGGDITIDVTGITAITNTGEDAFTAGASLDLASAGTATLTGRFDVTATSLLTVGDETNISSLVVDGTYTGLGNVELDVTGATAIDGSFTVGDDDVNDASTFVLNGDGVIRLGSEAEGIIFDVASDATLDGGAAVTMTGDVVVGGALDLDSDGTTTLIGTLDVAGLSDLNVGGDLAIDGSYTGKESTTINVTGSTTLDGTLDVTNALRLTGAGAITLADTVTATGNATINGKASVSLNGSLDVDGNLDLDSVGNTTLTGILDIAGTSDLTVSDNLVIDGNYTGGAKVTIDVVGTTAITNSGENAFTVGGALDLDSVGIAALTGTFDVTGASMLNIGEESTDSALELTGTFTGKDSTTMNVTGSTTLDGSLAVTNDLMIDGIGAITLGNSVSATGNMALNGGSSVSVAGLLDVGGSLDLDSAGNTELSGTVSVGGTSGLTVGENLAIAGDYTGRDNVRLKVAGATELDGELDVTGNLVIEGTGAITLDDTVKVSGDATLRGSDSIAITGSTDIDGSLLLESVDSTTLTGAFAIGGTSELKVGGEENASDLTITGDFTGRDKVTLTVTGTTDLDGTLVVINDLLITGTDAITLTNQVDVAGDATIEAGAAVTITGDVTIGGKLALETDAGTTLDGTFAIDGTSGLDVGGDLTIGGDYTGAADVTLTVAGATELEGELDVTGNLVIDGTGAITTISSASFIRAERLDINASTGIGTEAQPLQTEVNVLSLSVDQGDVFLTNTSDALVLLDSSVMGLGRFQLQTSSDLVIAGSHEWSGGENRLQAQGALSLEAGAEVRTFSPTLRGTYRLPVPTFGDLELQADSVTFGEGSSVSSLGDVDIRAEDDIRITGLSASRGAVSLTSASGQLIGEAVPSGVNVRAKALTVNAEGFALRGLEAGQLAGTVAGLVPSPLRVDVDSVVSVNGLSDVLNLVIEGDGHLFEVSDGTLVLHLVSAGNQSGASALDPLELPVEVFEAQVGLVFRDGVPGREGVSVDALIEETWAEVDGLIRGRLESLSQAEADSEAEDDEDESEPSRVGLFGLQGDWDAWLSSQGVGTPGYNLSAGQGLSSVLGQVPGLQPRVTGELLDNPNLYDVFIDDFELVF
ncbi:hypothetical protein [Marinobacter sp. DSM 26671]|uniref:hypothetical protein n=1 Tax=Marinobacter sp. DSM 26671 TaxID=1761793 RepID=UPI001113E5A9|nr:hypothetical protein [Marinobacter sp. DSM 26671]